MDSGASEHVINENAVPEIPQVSSVGSRTGLVYSHAGAGAKGLPNTGEQRFRMRTEDNIRLAIVCQNADVVIPLLSVAKITDSGAEVIFRKGGGEIRHPNGVIVQFPSQNNTYQLETEVIIEERPITDFTRPE